MKASTATSLLFKISVAINFCLNITIDAQVNFVQNGSFENRTDTCLDYNTKILFWDTLKSGGGGATFIYSSCASSSNQIIPHVGGNSYQWPKDGNTFIGFKCYNPGPFGPGYIYERSYYQNELSAFLEKGHTYCVRFHVSLLNECKYAITELGAYFDDGSIHCQKWGVANVNPQVKSAIGVYLTDTLTWMTIEGNFVASGMEKYLTLGNFKSTSLTSTLIMTAPTNYTWQSHTSFYLFDDVSVIDADLEAFAGRDTFYTNPGDSVYIGRAREVGLDDRCTWYKLPNVTTPVASSVAGMYIQPQGVEQYMVRQEICGNVKYDTVTVYPGVLNVNDFLHSPLKLWPQPCSGSFELLLPMQGEYTVNIHNALGRLVHTQTLNQSRTVVTIETLPPGVYSLTVLSDNGLRWSRKLLVE